MRALFVVFEPDLGIDLKLIEAQIKLLSKRGSEKFVEHHTIEALDKIIGTRRGDLRIDASFRSIGGRVVLDASKYLNSD